MWGVTDPRLWMNLLSDPGLLLFSFLYRSTSWTCTFSPSLRSGCLSFPPATFLWEKLAGFIFCYFSGVSFYFCFVFVILFFFVSTKLWMHLLSSGCSLGRHGRGGEGGLLFVQMFTRLKLNLDSLWSSALLHPVVCDAPRPRCDVRAVFPPAFFFIFYFFYNVREILEELLILRFIGMYLKCGEIWGLALLPLRGCPWMLEWLCVCTDDQIRPALHSLLCNWASIINWNVPCQAGSHLILSF